MSPSNDRVSVIRQLILDPEVGLKPYLQEKLDLENRLTDFKAIPGSPYGYVTGKLSIDLISSTTEILDPPGDTQYSDTHFELRVTQLVSVVLSIALNKDIEDEWSIAAAEIQTILDVYIVRWSQKAREKGLIEEDVDFIEGSLDFLNDLSAEIVREFEVTYSMDK